MKAFQLALALPAAVALCATFAVAQGERRQPQQPDFEKLRDEKLAKEVFQKAPWIVDDYDKALAQAKETGKPIFAYFTRSYAG